VPELGRRIQAVNGRSYMAKTGQCGGTERKTLRCIRVSWQIIAADRVMKAYKKMSGFDYNNCQSYTNAEVHCDWSLKLDTIM